MIKIDRDRKGLVRVVLGISNRDSTYVSTDYQHCEENDNIRAVGFWHRHDEPDLETKLNVDARRILDCYMHFPKCSGAIIGIEWKDYIS